MFLGAIFNSDSYYDYAKELKLHADFFHREILIVNFEDVCQLVKFVKNRENDCHFHRIIVNDFTEFKEWEEFTVFAKACLEYGTEFSILQQDLNSDVPVEFGYIMDVI